MSLAEQHRDALDIVEDEILLLLKDSEALLASLRDLPEKEDQAKEASSSLLQHLTKVQEGLLDNVTLLQDYLPYERSATQSRLKARQARADLSSVCATLESFPDDDGEGDSLVGDDEESTMRMAEESGRKRVRYDSKG